MKRSAAPALVAIIAIASVCTAHRSADRKEIDIDLADDLRALQGTWEFTADVGDRVIRSEKTIDGETEVVRRYDVMTGKLIAKHQSTFRLSKSGGVRVLTFTFENGRQGSYLYRLEKDRLYEVLGMLQADANKNNRSAPVLIRWKRVKRDDDNQPDVEPSSR